MNKNGFLVILCALVMCFGAHAQNAVHVADAGTLGSLLTERGLLDADELIVTGHLNGEDIHVLRSLCGGYFNDQDSELQVGEDVRFSLKRLDLSGATTVASSMPFKSPGGNSWPCWITTDGEIPYNMFDGCSALETLVMPDESLARGNWYAVANNANLKELYVGKSIKGFGSWGENCPRLERLVLPAGFEYWGGGVFQESFAVKEVVCKAAVPPALGRHTVTEEDGKSYETSAPMIPCAATCTLVVPLGCKTLYEQAEGWKEFGTIMESADITGVKNIVTDKQNLSQTEVFSLEGIRVNTNDALSMPRGIYVVKSGRQARKVAVK